MTPRTMAAANKTRWGDVVSLESPSNKHEYTNYPTTAVGGTQTTRNAVMPSSGAEASFSGEGGRGISASPSARGFARPGSRQPLSERFPRVGALTAAGVIWERSHNSCTPLVRQVMTFEEMATLKARRSAETLAASERMRMGMSRPSTSAAGSGGMERSGSQMLSDK